MGNDSGVSHATEIWALGTQRRCCVLVVNIGMKGLKNAT